jgi:hypothetical protein
METNTNLAWDRFHFNFIKKNCARPCHMTTPLKICQCTSSLPLGMWSPDVLSLGPDPRIIDPTSETARGWFSFPTILHDFLFSFEKFISFGLKNIKYLTIKLWRIGEDDQREWMRVDQNFSWEPCLYNDNRRSGNELHPSRVLFIGSTKRLNDYYSPRA